MKKISNSSPSADLPLIVEEVPQSEKTGTFLFIFGTIVSVIIIFVSILVYITYLQTPPKPAIVIVPTPTSAPTEIPKQILKNEDITIEIVPAGATPTSIASIQKKLKLAKFVVALSTPAKEKVKGVTFFISPLLAHQSGTIGTDIKSVISQANYAGDLIDSNNQVKIILGY